MATQLDRDVAVAKGLVSVLHQHGRNSILALLVGMYCRHKRGEVPLSISAAFVLGNFKHGRIVAKTIETAETMGYIRREKPRARSARSFTRRTNSSNRSKLRWMSKCQRGKSQSARGSRAK